MIIDCKILVYNKELSEIGLPSKDTDKWVPFSINTEEIFAIKPYGEEDYPNATLIYCKSGDSFAIDIDYNNFRNKFKESK